MTHELRRSASDGSTAVCYSILVGFSAYRPRQWEIVKVDIHDPVWSYSAPAVADELRRLYQEWLAGDLVGTITVRNTFVTLACGGVAVCDFVRVDL